MVLIKINLFLILVLLSISYYWIDETKVKSSVQELNIKENQKIKDLGKSSSLTTSSLYDGHVIGIIEIKAINIKNAIIKSSLEKLQDNIDLDNVTTTTNLDVSSLTLFAHYYNIKNKMFNRLSELKKEEKVLIYNDDISYQYRVKEYGVISRDKLKDIQGDIILVTCTNTFSNKEYYYVSAQKIND